jgi:hypothetical protein
VQFVNADLVIEIAGSELDFIDSGISRSTADIEGGMRDSEPKVPSDSLRSRSLL